MNINIVTVDSGWILQKIADRIKETNEDIFSLTYWEPRTDVDANFYVDIQNCYRGPTCTHDIGLFTHLDRDSTDSILPHWLKIDYIIHQCTKYYDIFSDLYNKDKMCVLPPGEIHESFTLKKPVIGIFQRGQYEGKGFHFMRDLVDQHPNILKQFKFVFVGSGWDDVVRICNKNGIKTFYYDDSDYSMYPKLYKNVDYILIPSLWEGGPMSIIEAWATGTPIIGAKVGLLNKDFTADYSFDPGNSQQLIDILNSIIAPLMQRRDKVSHLNYQKYGQMLIEIVDNLNNK
jgi:glycosyltransferase involved in cell wall biosynthesis